MTATNPQRWRPQSFMQLQDKDMEGVWRELDLSLKLAFDSIYSAQDISVENPAGGFAVAFGHTDVLGSKTIATGLTTVTEVVVSLRMITAVNEWVTAQPSQTAGSIDVRVWKPTAAGDTTPIASVVTRSVAWSVKGA